MCDPLTLTAVSAGVGALGTGVSAVQAAATANYQAKIAGRNARMESERAREVIEQGKIENQQLGRKYAALKGEQRAAMAANGVAVDFGSAADVQADTNMFQREDQAALFRNQLAEVKGIDISAANQRAEAQAKRQAASGALVSGAFGAASTILGGASQYSYLKGKMAGKWN